MNSYQNSNLIKIGDSQVANSHFPVCVCPYQASNNSFMMVEVNTGYHKGSLKPISQSFSSYTELMNNFNIHSTFYPVLHNHLIFNDISARH